MKKILIFSVLIIAGVCFSSCKDYLKEDVKSQVTDNYYSTDQGLYEGVASVYTTCRELVTDPLFRVSQISDLADFASSFFVELKIQVLSGDNSRLEDVWTTVYTGIMRVDRLISYIENNTEKNETQMTYIAELRTLRSFFYWVAVELWGSQAHFTNGTVYDEYNESMNEINQQPVEAFYDQILDDVDYGIENLPLPSEITEKGRMNQGIAKALKARYLMSLAGYGYPECAQSEYFSDYYQAYTRMTYTGAPATQEECYTEAMKLAKEVITDYNYSLQSEWKDIFASDNENNSEVVWAVQFIQELKYDEEYGQWHRCFTERTCQTIQQKVNADGSISYSGISCTRPSESYSMPCHSRAYGREYRSYMPTYKWIMAYDSRDKRREETFLTTCYKLPNEDGLQDPEVGDTILYMPFRTVTPEEENYRLQYGCNGKGYRIDGLNEVYDLDNPNEEGYGGPRTIGRSSYHTVKKFLDDLRVTAAKDNNGRKDAMIIRLAEMYLIGAECAYKLGDGDAAVREWLQPLWNRAFDNQDDNPYKDKTVDLDFILDERAREVGAEWQRWFTLKRTWTLVPRIKKWVPVCKDEAKQGILGVKDYIDDFCYVRPVPLNETYLMTNWTEDMQTPGY